MIEHITRTFLLLFLFMIVGCMWSEDINFFKHMNNLEFYKQTTTQTQKQLL